jgi:hypothetical protein
VRAFSLFYFRLSECNDTLLSSFIVSRERFFLCEAGIMCLFDDLHHLYHRELVNNGALL